MTTDSKPLRRIWASAPMDEVYYEAVKLTHSAWPSPVHITNQPQSFMAPEVKGGVDVEWQPMPFMFTKPKREGGAGTVDVEFTVANIDRVIADYVEMAITKPGESIVARVYVFSDKLLGEGPQNAPLVVYLADVALTGVSLKASASRTDMLNRAYPRGRYTRYRFPGLAR